MVEPAYNVVVQRYSHQLVKQIIVTHEIGHWVLKLHGFQAFLRKRQKQSDIEIMLNPMAQHPPLYVLQRSIGHEPQAEIDSRSLNDIKLFSKGKEAQQREVRIRDALMLADDILNCSEENHTALKNVISKNRPNTSKLFRMIIELASSYNLLVHDQNLIFCEQIIETLKLGDDWYNPDEVKGLASSSLARACQIYVKLRNTFSQSNPQALP